MKRSGMTFPLNEKAALRLHCICKKCEYQVHESVLRKIIVLHTNDNSLIHLLFYHNKYNSTKEK